MVWSLFRCTILVNEHKICWFACHAVWAILKLSQETGGEGAGAESKAEIIRETNKIYVFIKQIYLRFTALWFKKALVS